MYLSAFIFFTRLIIFSQDSVHAQSLQLCLTLCDPMDCLPGSSVHGILQARILEWVAMPSSWIFLTQGTNLGLLSFRQILYHLSHQGSPHGEGTITALVFYKEFLGVEKFQREFTPQPAL